MGLACRLDFWLISSHLMACTSSADIRPAIRADHNAISLVLNLKPRDRGAGYWKLNTSLLDDDKYRVMIRKVIRDTIGEYSLKYNKRGVLDMVKIKVKEQSIKFAKNKAWGLKNKRHLLQEELKNIERELDDCRQRDKILEEKYLEKKKDLDKLYINALRGAQVRSRVKWYEEGERNTKYFLGLEKKMYRSKQLNKLMVDTNIVTDQEKILNAAVNFYKKLYSSKAADDNDITQYLNRVGIDICLNPVASKFCDGLISKTECKKAIWQMKPGKSPGLDGLPIEFYTSFWDELENLVVDSINEGYADGGLATSQRVGLITLIYKKGNRTDLNNWRPISLLNHDYKILSCVLANRMKKVLPNIINSGQVGYIKGRFVGQNVRLIEDVIDFAEKRKKGGAILFLDFFKAFDSVEHNFMLRALKKFGFGESFLKWIETIYRGTSSALIINGCISNRFNIHRGIRQGCPLSALLFLVVVEVLGHVIRNDPELEGFIIKDEGATKAIKISQLADDTQIYISRLKSLSRVLNIINEYGKFSGLMLNKDKTEGLKLGVWKNKTDLGLISWPVKAIKALGIYFGSNKNELKQLNWETKIDNIKTMLNTWKKRYLSIFGRITILKCLAMSKLLYCASMIEMPGDVLNKANKIFYDFLWGGKKGKVNRSIVINKLEKGGLQMINLRSMVKALKCRWISRIINGKNELWITILEAYLSKYGGSELILKYNMDKSILNSITKMLPAFYREMLNNWFEVRTQDEPRKLSPNNIGEQIIWGSKFIKYKNKALFYKEWIESDILFVADVFKDGQFILPTKLLETLKCKKNWIFQLLAVKAAMPKNWCEIMKTVRGKIFINRKGGHSLLRDSEGKFKKVIEFTCKDFYCNFVLKNTIQSYASKIWEESCGKADNWEKIWHFKLKTVVVKKIAQFNYFLLYDKLPHGYNLWKWKIANHAECEICVTKDNCEHFLFKCSSVAPFWQKVNHIMNEVWKTKFCILWKHIVYGYMLDFDKFDDINIVVNIAAFAVYKAKIMKTRCTERFFKEELMYFNFFKKSENLRKVRILI